MDYEDGSMAIGGRMNMVFGLKHGLWAEAWPVGLRCGVRTIPWDLGCSIAYGLYMGYRLWHGLYS